MIFIDVMNSMAGLMDNSVYQFLAASRRLLVIETVVEIEFFPVLYLSVSNVNRKIENSSELLLILTSAPLV